ncbi:MAG: hypothetical protein MHM6MM_004339 [Cercozoa sp. M6MM]
MSSWRQNALQRARQRGDDDLADRASTVSDDLEKRSKRQRSRDRGQEARRREQHSREIQKKLEKPRMRTDTQSVIAQLLEQRGLSMKDWEGDDNELEAKAMKMTLKGKEKKAQKLRDKLRQLQEIRKLAKELQADEDKHSVKSQVDDANALERRAKQRKQQSRREEVDYDRQAYKMFTKTAGDTDEAFDAMSDKRKTKPKPSYKQSGYQRHEERHRRCEKCLSNGHSPLSSSVALASKHAFVLVPRRHPLELNEDAAVDECFILPAQHVSALTRLEDPEVQRGIREMEETIAATLAKRTPTQTPIFLEHTRAIRHQGHTMVQVLAVPTAAVPLIRAAFVQELRLSGESALALASASGNTNQIVQTKNGMSLARFVPPRFGYFHARFGTKVGEDGVAKLLDNEDVSPYFGAQVVLDVLQQWREQNGEDAGATPVEMLLRAKPQSNPIVARRAATLKRELLEHARANVTGLLA